MEKKISMQMMKLEKVLKSLSISRPKLKKPKE
jgi:hypothetical protein